MVGNPSWPSGWSKAVLPSYCPCNRPTTQRPDSSRMRNRFASDGTGSAAGGVAYSDSSFGVLAGFRADADGAVLGLLSGREDSTRDSRISRLFRIVEEGVARSSD